LCGLTHVRSADIIRQIEADGWRHARTTGSHRHFRHPMKTGIVTVPHPVKDVPKGTIRSIERQSGVKLLR